MTATLGTTGGVQRCARTSLFLAVCHAAFGASCSGVASEALLDSSVEGLPESSIDVDGLCLLQVRTCLHQESTVQYEVPTFGAPVLLSSPFDADTDFDEDFLLQTSSQVRHLPHAPPHAAPNLLAHKANSVPLQSTHSPHSTPASNATTHHEAHNLLAHSANRDRVPVQSSQSPQSLQSTHLSNSTPNEANATTSHQAANLLAHNANRVPSLIRHLPPPLHNATFFELDQHQSAPNLLAHKAKHKSSPSETSGFSMTEEVQDQEGDGTNPNHPADQSTGSMPGSPYDAESLILLSPRNDPLLNGVNDPLLNAFQDFDTRSSHQNSWEMFGNSKLSAFILSSLAVLFVIATWLLTTYQTSSSAKMYDAHAILDHISKTSERAARHESFLCPVPVVPKGGAAYLLPDLSEAQQSIQMFDILSRSGVPVLGVVVNNSDEDAGVLLRDSVGKPLAFVGTSQALVASGRLPIVKASTDQGEDFGTLKREPTGTYSIFRQNRLVMRFEGDVPGRGIRLYSAYGTSTPTRGVQAGSTRPCTAGSHKQSQLELHLGAGTDASLAILCLLAITRMEAAAATTANAPETAAPSNE